MTEAEYTWDEGGRLAQLNSLAWQQRGEMIVGNCPACRCVECVRERGTEWREWNEGGGCGCVSVCSAVLKACQCLVVSAGSFLSGVLERCQQPEGDTAWHGRVWSGLPAALWMREQQQVNQCIMQGTNKDFIPSSGTHLNVCTQTSWAWALFWFGCSWINPSVKLWNLKQSWLLCWFGLLCSLF